MYIQEQGKTDEVLDKDGWFHTGDIGELLAFGSLKIIDRKKALFKLSQGEHAPSACRPVRLILRACHTANSSILSRLLTSVTGLPRRKKHVR